MKVELQHFNDRRSLYSIIPLANPCSLGRRPSGDGVGYRHQSRMIASLAWWDLQRIVCAKRRRIRGVCEKSVDRK